MHNLDGRRLIRTVLTSMHLNVLGSQCSPLSNGCNTLNLKSSGNSLNLGTPLQRLLGFLILYGACK